MRPTFASLDAAYGGLPDAIRFCNRVLGPCISSNSEHLFAAQSGAPVFGTFTSSRATARCHVRHILQLRAQHKMEGITARRRVAIVQNILRGVERPEHHLIREPMGQLRALGDTEMAITFARG
jgi:hypothetical protein